MNFMLKRVHIESHHTFAILHCVPTVFWC